MPQLHLVHLRFTPPISTTCNLCNAAFFPSPTSIVREGDTQLPLFNGSPQLMSGGSKKWKASPNLDLNFPGSLTWIWIIVPIDERRLEDITTSTSLKHICMSTKRGIRHRSLQPNAACNDFGHGRRTIHVQNGSTMLASFSHDYKP